MTSSPTAVTRWGLHLLVLAAAILLLGCGSHADPGPDRPDGDTSMADESDAVVDMMEPEDQTSDTQPDADASDVEDAPDDFDPGPRELLNGTPVRFGHVVDGDTLDVFVGDQAVKVYTIRLKGLAAPECFKEYVQTENFGRRNQCATDDEYYGVKSREELLDLVTDKEGYLTCDDVAVGEWCPTDPYDRYLAYIEVDGQDIATTMADRGAGFSYTSFYATKRADICAAEYDARGAGRGMWAADPDWTQVVQMMHQQTQNWYFDHHDTRCDEALGL